MDNQLVLFANEAFYLAFSQRDLMAMDQIWAKTAPTICIHPGWPVLAERDAIMASWRNILQNPATGPVTTHHARVFAYGSLSVVICYEEIGGDMYVASNSFVLEHGEARMVGHTAAICAAPPPQEDKPEPLMQ